MFIVSLTYIAPISEIDKHLADHRAYLKTQYDLGHFIASGSKKPRVGGVIIAAVETREILEEILKNDPFTVNQLVRAEITEFEAVLTCKELAEIKFK